MANPKGTRALTPAEKSKRAKVKDRFIGERMKSANYIKLTAFIDRSQLASLDAIAKGMGDKDGLKCDTLIKVNELMFLALRELIKTHPEETKHIEQPEMSLHEACGVAAKIDFVDWSDKFYEDLK